ncbi:MAG: type VI secretion system tube protein Hcp [Verrucomicrobiae bacterium]|nr:type VI secretion system tube protein Hcp [Verrucomicrobiae bacterium]MCP5534077.1 type VI secretion system tube protein Hcp [Akkermansiaceae bacterium]MCP5545136.1 type VI secretion system tube protein Hcp [Akkermansiaceae bacterium]MCP5546617.1 type VI secretion system tube protein Hcp [Akkermansiaceae bacterium]
MRPLRPSRLSKTLALVPPAVTLFAPHAEGAFTGYIKIGDIEGEAVAEGRDGWIDVESVSWGASRNVATPSGGSTNREASNPTVSELTFVKKVDSASPPLFLNAVAGESIGTVTLELVTAGKPYGDKVFYRITLSDVMVSSQNVSADTDTGETEERITLNFAKINVEFLKLDEKNGAVTATISGGFNLATGKTF